MSRPQRIAGFPYLGLYRYFLTFCTLGRKNAFRDPGVVVQTLVQFRRTAALERFAILAYCFMPDHVHLLLEGLSESSNFQRFAKLAKQRSGGVFARSTGELLWQEGFYERILREGDDIEDVARYVIANPVRAGLVASPAEYPYVGSDVWSLDELLEGLV